MITEILFSDMFYFRGNIIHDIFTILSVVEIGTVHYDVKMMIIYQKETFIDIMEIK